MRGGDKEKRNKFIFENLEVYQRSLNFSKEVCEIASNFPYKYSRLSDQFIGATISIPQNIAEGCGRRTKKDANNFYGIARGSTFECVPLIEVCFRLKLIQKDLKEKWYNECVELSKMINGLIKSQYRNY